MEGFEDFFGAIVIRRDVRENQARQIWVGVVADKGTGLQVGEMTYIGSNALFEVRRVRAFGEHIGVVIRFKKTSVALAEILADLVVGNTNIGHHTDAMPADFDAETNRLGGIVLFWE